MIFLYRFELLPLGADLHAFSVPSTASATFPLHLITNSEKAIVLAEDPGLGPFLPSRGLDLVPQNTYAPLPITHEGLRYDSEEQTGTTTIKLPLRHPLAVFYSQDPSAFRLWVRIFEWSNSTANPVLTGLVTDTSYDEQMMAFTVRPLERVLDVEGLRARHPRTCPKAVFTSECGANPDGSSNGLSHKVLGSITAVSEGLVITVPEAAARPNGFFNGGVAQIAAYTVNNQVGVPATVGGFRRTIVRHEGSLLTLQAPIPDLSTYTMLAELPEAPPLGLDRKRAVTLLRGCNGLQGTCIQVFNNGRNFGGFPNIPLKDPNQIPIRETF